MRTIKGRFEGKPEPGAIVATAKRYGMKPFSYEILKVNSKSVVIRGRETNETFQVRLNPDTNWNVFSEENYEKFCNS